MAAGPGLPAPSNRGFHQGRLPVVVHVRIRVLLSCPGVCGVMIWDGVPRCWTYHATTQSHRHYSLQLNAWKGCQAQVQAGGSLVLIAALPCSVPHRLLLFWKCFRRSNHTLLHSRKSPDLLSNIPIWQGSQDVNRTVHPPRVVSAVDHDFEAATKQPARMDWHIAKRHPGYR
jgi:hypothetical protein